MKPRLARPQSPPPTRAHTLAPAPGLRHAQATLLTALALLPLAACHKAKSSAGLPPPPPAVSTPTAATRSAPTVRRTPPPTQPSDDLGQQPVSTEIGLASWYGPPYHNHQAADGSLFDQNALTAAHRTLPLGTSIRVTNLATGESVIVKITDRGPFVPNRILDLSLAAAKVIEVYRMGVAKVRIDAFPHISADPAGRWCVQIGPFLDQESAIQLKNDLLSRYHTAKVIQFPSPTGFWVRINPLQPDRASASRILEAIHIPDADPYLVRLN